MDVREKLVAIVEKASERTLPKNTCHTNIVMLVNALIEEGVTVQEWISVKDRLPENDGQYLIFTTQYFTPDHIDEIDHRDGIEISGYYKGYGFLSTNGIYAKYWCCLPQPPKGE